MEQNVIIEKLKESINGRKVKVAVFYTFNFDTHFFENYLLPLFLPHVNFSEIEIQNTILWRKYIKDLPPVTVYCDFHAKSNDAPTLSYEVRAIDLKSKGGTKPCFHPKNSFILLDDDTLLVMTGSNNLSVGGWCTNIEGVSIFEMKSGIYFPHPLKYELWGFLKGISTLGGAIFTEAENKLDVFFKQRNYTHHIDKSFYSPFIIDKYKSLIPSTLYKLFEHLNRENDNLPFSRIEVISPYFSTNVDFTKELTNLSNNHLVYALTPYCATNLASISKETYTSFQEAGVLWSRLLQINDDKLFRLNHSKIYRLKGEEKMFTIIGSANFTEAGWNGSKPNGNIESAMIYEEPVSNWVDWLIDYNNPDILFSESNGDETDTNQRYDAPDMLFRLDWSEKKLYYQFLKKSDFNGTINLPGRNYEIVHVNEMEILLNKDQINALADNSIIKVHQYITQREFYFFPMQVNFESKPYGSKLKLNDRELIELWQQVSIKEKDKNEIGNLIEKFILSRVDSEGELLVKKSISKSTMNMIASHINALIKLEARLFELPVKVGEFAKSKELLDYYLFTNNIDTLTGYRNLLKEMESEKAILPGVLWFLLNLLVLEFYDYTKIAKSYDHLRFSKERLNEKVVRLKKEISADMEILKTSMKSEGINKNLFTWIGNQIQN
jgi:hypothetical protein